ncbi:hypothetical protein GCM10017752_64260 [Streptomyces roseoviridis]
MRNPAPSIQPQCTARHALVLAYVKFHALTVDTKLEPWRDLMMDISLLSLDSFAVTDRLLLADPVVVWDGS